MGFTRAQVAKALGTTRSTIENMIRHGHFGSDLYPTPSEKYGWTVKDAVRLAATLMLGPFVGKSMASMLSDHAAYDSVSNLFLVAAAPDWNNVQGVWSCETVTRDELKDIRGAAFVIELDVLVMHVTEGLKRAANEQE